MLLSISKLSIEDPGVFLWIVLSPPGLSGPWYRAK